MINLLAFAHKIQINEFSVLTVKDVRWNFSFLFILATYKTILNNSDSKVMTTTRIAKTKRKILSNEKWEMKMKMNEIKLAQIKFHWNDLYNVIWSKYTH